MTNTRDANSPSAPLPPKRSGCRYQFLARDVPGGRWRLCGRATCCRECRDQWAWKMGEALRSFFEKLPPTYFVVIHGRAGMTNKEFMAAVGKLLKDLCRARRGTKYLRVYEFANGVMHAHVLLWGAADPRESLNKVSTKANVRFTLEKVRDPIATAYYVVKHLQRPHQAGRASAPGLPRAADRSIAQAVREAPEPLVGGLARRPGQERTRAGKGKGTT